MKDWNLQEHITKRKSYDQDTPDKMRMKMTLLKKYNGGEYM